MPVERLLSVTPPSAVGSSSDLEGRSVGFIPVVEVLSDALRYGVKPFGVDVVLVQPTGVRTRFVEKRTALIPEGEGPYAAFNENYNAVVKAMFSDDARGIVSPEDVAGAIVEVAGAARPRARYKVGLGAHVIPRVRRLLGDARGTPRWRGSSP